MLDSLTVTNPDEAARALALVAALTAQREAAEHDFEEIRERQRVAILDALAAGNGPSEVARAAHLTRSRINQIREQGRA